MKTYNVRIPVKHVDGHQIFTIEADSEDAAIEAVKNGDGDFLHEELEVTELDWHGADAEASEK